MHVEVIICSYMPGVGVFDMQLFRLQIAKEIIFKNIYSISWPVTKILSCDLSSRITCWRHSVPADPKEQQLLVYVYIVVYTPIENSCRDFDKSCSKVLKNPQTIQAICSSCSLQRYKTDQNFKRWSQLRVYTTCMSQIHERFTEQ